MPTPALIIFIKNPEKGKVKTSLAAELGDDAALHIYNQLLEHTRSVTEFFSGEKYLFYSDYPNWNDAWDINTYRKRIQQGDNLGQRMEAAFTSVFDEGHDRAIIIGSDCYELSLQVINTAITDLDTHDVVIGPSHNGGYYLLGMRTPQSALFTNLQWTTGNSLEDTEALLKQSHLTFKQLPLLHDLQTTADLARSGLKHD